MKLASKITKSIKEGLRKLKRLYLIWQWVSEGVDLSVALFRVSLDKPNQRSKTMTNFVKNILAVYKQAEDHEIKHGKTWYSDALKECQDMADFTSYRYILSQV